MIRHPDLAQKLALLFSLRINPSIKNNSDLAQAVGVSKQGISRWCRGSETTQGNAVPHTQIDSVSKLFRIDALWFTKPIEEFETYIRALADDTSANKQQRPDKISLSLMPITPSYVIGRESEIGLLDSAWNNENVNVVQVVAFGGVGKSTLINAWLSNLDSRDYLGASRVYAWSFYWQGGTKDIRSSGDYFIEHALEWFGDENPFVGTAWVKANRLAELIRKSKTLLVLDGLEPMQNPPGPLAGQIDNPAVSLLVKELASDNNGLCVVTSRLEVADLSPYQDGRVESVHLKNFKTNDSAKLLKHFELHGTKSEFLQVAEKYSGHALSLSLLGSYISVVYDGNISKHSEIKNLLDGHSLGYQAKNVLRNYLDWFKDTPEQALLFLVGLYDRAVSLDDLQAISKSGNIEGLTASITQLNSAKLSFTLENLCKANLVTIDKRKNQTMLDCHPLVRDFLSDHLASEHENIWKKGHALVFYYLQSQALENPCNMTEMEPLFRAVIHGTQAGLYEEAFKVYFHDIKRSYSMLSNGSHYADQECIRSFFDRDSSIPKGNLTEEAKCHLKSSAAMNLMSLGQLDEAIVLAEESIDLFIQMEKWLDATSTAGPFLSMQIVSGDLAGAFALIEKLRVCIANTENSVIKAMACSIEAYAFHLAGDNDKAIELFKKSEAILIKNSPDSPVTFPTVSSYYCKFLLNIGETKKALDRSLITFSWRRENSWQVAIDTTSLLSTDVQVLGLIFLEIGDMVNATIYLERQVRLLKSADELLYLPTGLNARAMLYIEKKDFKAALQDLEEAVNVSKRTGARFGEWEAYLNLANYYLDQGDYENSQLNLNHALSVPDMEAYKFRDAEIDRIKEEIAANIGNDSESSTGSKNNLSKRN